MYANERGNQRAVIGYSKRLRHNSTRQPRVALAFQCDANFRKFPPSPSSQRWPASSPTTEDHQMFDTNAERAQLLDRLRCNLHRKKTPARLEKMAERLGIYWPNLCQQDRRTFAGCVSRLGWSKNDASWRWPPPASETLEIAA
jgi:hypothetical protein